MSKYRVNQRVVCKSDGREGIIRAREISHEGKRTDVKYLVDFGDGIDNWKVMKRCHLSPQISTDYSEPYIFKTYDADGGKQLTLAAMVETSKNYYMDDIGIYKTKFKVFRLGFSIYNGKDEFDPKIGKKYAVHRCKKNPFTVMRSDFGGEFNYDTVSAIMESKAKYILSHIDDFYRSEC